MSQVSIVMPVYNAARYIEDTLRSILRQTMGDFEVVIADDGTTDASLDMAAGFADPRIRILRHATNTGITAALNRGICASRSPYIALCAADDLLTPDSLALRLAHVRPSDSLICGQAPNIAAATTLADVDRYPPLPPETLQVFYGPTILMPRTTFERYGLFDEALSYKVDREMWVRLFGRAKMRTDRGTFTCLAAILGYYRVRPDSFQQTYKTLPAMNRDAVENQFNARVVAHTFTTAGLPHLPPLAPPDGV